MKRNLLNVITETVKTANASIERRSSRNHPDTVSHNASIVTRDFVNNCTVIDKETRLVEYNNKFYNVWKPIFNEYSLLEAKLNGDCISDVQCNSEYITDGAFRDCLDVETVRIGASVKKISKNAFAGCKNLTSVIFESRRGDNDHWSYLEIDKDAFAGCSKLLYVDICAYEYAEVHVNTGAFRNCKSLKWVTLNSLDQYNSVIFVRPRAFSGCTNIEFIASQNVCYHRGAFHDTGELEFDTMIELENPQLCADIAEDADIYWYKTPEEICVEDVNKFLGIKISSRTYEEVIDNLDFSKLALDDNLLDEMYDSMLGWKREKGEDLPPIKDEVLQPTAGWDEPL